MEVCVESGKLAEERQNGEYTSHVKAEQLFGRLDAALYALRIAAYECARSFRIRDQFAGS